MPIVKAQGKTIECESGANLRQVLLDNEVDVYNDAAKLINCHGLGTCGTCAIEIQGTVAAPSWREQARLSLPPHSPDRGRRLCCQVRVTSDLELTKYDGFWGQGDQTVWGAIAQEPA